MRKQWRLVGPPKDNRQIMGYNRSGAWLREPLEPLQVILLFKP
jgi:hypothetical protein